MRSRLEPVWGGGEKLRLFFANRGNIRSEMKNWETFSRIVWTWAPSAVPPCWRGYNGVRAGAAGQRSGTAEIASRRARSWNTTPRLLTLPPPHPSLSLSHLSSFTLPLFYLRSCRFLALHHPHPTSIHPPPSSFSSHTSLPLPAKHGGERERERGYGLIWISECISTSSSLGRGVVLQPYSCGGVMGPSAQGSLS